MILLTSCAVRMGVNHRVESGETPSHIAKAYDVDPAVLLRVNGIEDPRSIQPGDQLFIPGVNETQPVRVNYASRPSASDSGSSGTDQSNSGNSRSEDSAPDRSDPSGNEPDGTGESSSTETASVSSSGEFDPMWPCRGTVVKSFNGDPGADVTEQGIRIETDDEYVKAAESGRVRFAGQSDKTQSLGNLVIIQHGNSFYTVYAHLGGLDVSQNDTVSRGDRLGATGQSGFVDTPTCHFEIRQKNSNQSNPVPKDPEFYLGQAP